MTQIKIPCQNVYIAVKSDKASLADTTLRDTPKKGALTLTFLTLSLLLTAAGLFCHIEDYRKAKEIFSKASGIGQLDQCLVSKDAEKFDCFPEPDGSEEKCKARWIFYIFRNFSF